MSLLSRLFGGKPKAPEAVQPVEYEGFRIYPELMPEGGEFRLAARIEKEIGGENRVHRLIRADTIRGEDAVVSASVAKAKQMIDEQGERLFG